MVGTAAYEIQIGDGCVPLVPVRNCEILDPLIDAQATGTSFVPPAALPVDSAPPVGRQYYWRVRACFPDVCGPWSETRYVEVGRLRGDFDGDGFADVVASTTAPPAAQVFRGGADGPSEVPGTIGVFRGFEEELVNVAWVGDLNADGYADLAVVEPGGRSATSDIPGVVWIYPGGNASLGTVGSTPTTTMNAFFGGKGFGQTFSSGDFDGDGVSDLVICGDGNPVLVHGHDFSRVSLLGPTGLDFVPQGCGAVADFDGDGRADVVLSGVTSGPTSTSGAIGVYFGGTDGTDGWLPDAMFLDLGTWTGPTAAVPTAGGLPKLAATVLASQGSEAAANKVAILSVRRGSTTKGIAKAEMVIRAPIEAVSAAASSNEIFGGSLGTWRSDGRAPGLLAVGAPNVNEVLLYDLAGALDTPALTLIGSPSFEPAMNRLTGKVLGFPGDVDGDGSDDMVVGAPLWGLESGGEVYWFKGGASAGDTPAITFSLSGGFGVSVD